MKVDLNKVVRQFESRGYEYIGGEEKNDTSVDELLAQLKQFYLRYFEAEFIDERIALPEDYKQFLSEFQGYFYSDKWAAFYGIDSVFEQTKDWYERWDFDYAERKDTGKLTADDTLWLNFGYWSDKHEMVLCIDKTNRFFGKVIDTRGHPLLHGSIYVDSFYDSFKIYAEDYKANYAYDK